MPYLMSSNAAATIDFIVNILGGSEIFRMEHSPGVILHAEARIGDSVMMIAQSNDMWPSVPAMLYVYVEDVDKVYEQAISAGAQSKEPPKDQFYGDRSCMVSDAGGILWGIASKVEEVSPEELERRSQQFKGASGG
jgi:PhnB protein